MNPSSRPHNHNPPTRYTKKLVTVCATVSGKLNAGLEPTTERFQFKKASATDSSTVDISVPLYPENLIFYEHYDRDRPLPVSLSFMLLGGDNDGHVDFDFTQYKNVKMVNFSHSFASIRSIFYVISQMRSCEEVRIIFSKENIEETELDSALKKRALKSLKSCPSVKTFRIEFSDDLRTMAEDDVSNSRIPEVLQHMKEYLPLLKKVKMRSFKWDYKLVRGTLQQKGIYHKHRLEVKRGFLHCDLIGEENSLASESSVNPRVPSAGKYVERDRHARKYGYSDSPSTKEETNFGMLAREKKMNGAATFPPKEKARQEKHDRGAKKVRFAPPLALHEENTVCGNVKLNGTDKGEKSSALASTKPILPHEKLDRKEVKGSGSSASLAPKRKLDSNEVADAQIASPKKKDRNDNDYSCDQCDGTCRCSICGEPLQNDNESVCSVEPFSPWESEASPKSVVENDIFGNYFHVSAPPRSNVLGVFQVRRQEVVMQVPNPMELPEEFPITSDDVPFIEGVHYDRRSGTKKTTKKYK